MTIEIDQEQERGPYEAPKLTVLDSSATGTGPFPDPTEDPGFFELS